MGYSISVTQAGQMTIPKALREKYGILNGVFVDEENDKIVVVPKKSAAQELDEALEKIQSALTTEEKQRIKDNAGMTYKRAIEELEYTPEGRREIEKEYEEGIYA